LEALNSSPGRVRDIAALRGLGYTYREIAQHYGVTPQAVSLLLSRNRRNMKSIGGKPQLAALSARATNALRRLGIGTREEAIAAQALAKLAHTRNCGRKTVDEIARWMTDNA
jgi:transposase-like protein